MADLTLAEANENVWLVRGEAYVDDLLNGTLSSDLTIEIVVCANRAEVMALWEQANGAVDEFGAMPWVIHPGIVKRIKRQLGARPDARAIAFTPWSAMMDEAAQGVIEATVAWLLANPAQGLILRQSCPATAPAGLADLQRLRGQLVVASFVRAGIAEDRLAHETITAETDADRLELVTGASD